MNTESIVKDKSYQFAIRIVNAYKYLTSSQKEFVLSKQMLRSGTAVGALIREGIHAQSRPDFLNKMNVALKEAYETEYWISLLHDTGFFSVDLYESIHEDSVELVKLLTSIVKTMKDSLGR